MKKTLFVFLFIMLIISVFAQKGMFDISYGQNAGALNKILLSKGFTIDTRDDAYTKYNNSKIPRLESLYVLYSSADSLVSGWTARYKVNGDQAVIDKYKAELTAMHNVDPYYDDYWGCDIWELENDNAIYVSTTDDDNILVIEYTYYDEEDDWY